MSWPTRTRGLVAASLSLAAAAALGAAIPAAASAQSATVTSFDATAIHVNYFPAAGLKAGHRTPTVLVGPGWGSPGDTNPNDSQLGPLRAAGFNVVTWDPRGFGSSGGTVQVDSPRFEGRDVSAIITWVAHQRWATLDARNDPRVGMAGGSYGGGIQLVTAAIDRRVDAIVPDIAWHSLITSLDRNDTAKTGWSGLLYLAGLAGSHGRLNPLITRANADGAVGRPLSAQERAFFASRGPGSLVADIHIPTLIIQGTVDTLFSLQEGVTNYEVLRRHHVPVKTIWFCGGHGICLDNPGDAALASRETLAWLERYLMRARHIHTGPGFTWVDQRGHEHNAPAYPAVSHRRLSGRATGTLTIDTTGGAGPIATPPGSGPAGGAVAGITPGRAANAVNLRLAAPARTRLLMWAPTLTLTYRATGSRHSTRVFAQLVDDATGEVLGHQITPVPVTLDGRTHTITLPLEIVAAAVARGEHLTLQITPSTVAYAAQRATGTIRFSRIAITIPAT